MIQDVLDKNLDVVFCGTAKGRASVLKGFYYANPGNKFYDILFQSGFTSRKLEPMDCYDIIKYKIGLTDLVPTEFGNDNEISNDSYNVPGFFLKMEKYQPKYIAFNGKKGAAFALGYNGRTRRVQYGLQKETIGKSKIVVLPSTSSRARRFWNEKYWSELKEMISNSTK